MSTTFRIYRDNETTAVTEFVGTDGVAVDVSVPTTGWTPGTYTIKATRQYAGLAESAKTAWGTPLTVNAAAASNLLDRDSGRKAYFFQGTGTSVTLSGMNIPQNSICGVVLVTSAATLPTATSCTATINGVTVSGHDTQSGAGALGRFARTFRYSDVDPINPSAAWTNVGGTVTVNVAQDVIGVMVVVAPDAAAMGATTSLDYSGGSQLARPDTFYTTPGSPSYSYLWQAALAVVRPTAGGAYSGTFTTDGTYPADAGFMSFAATGGQAMFVMFDKYNASPAINTQYRGEVISSVPAEWVSGAIVIRS